MHRQIFKSLIHFVQHVVPVRKIEGFVTEWKEIHCYREAKV